MTPCKQQYLDRYHPPFSLSMSRPCFDKPLSQRLHDMAFASVPSRGPLSEVMANLQGLWPYYRDSEERAVSKDNVTVAHSTI